MDVDRWTTVDALFEETVDLPALERSRILEERCGADYDLKQEVEQMLLAHDRARGFLSRPAAESAAELITDNFTALNRPEKVGNYRIVDEIGRGGMGTVYEGRRDDDDFDQRVAIKVLQHGQTTADVIRRFLSERQILASLEHEHIARLYDGGVLEDGRPYFVMEYVDGLPIDRYCNANGLNVRERLGLLRRVADTVRFAHHNFVVHRDLKPSNIMVTPDGQVKLLDFGLAKVVAGEGLARSNTTQMHTRWMTPEYASPEQILGRPITTATDVYQLGVVAYEVLTGIRPFSGDAKSAFVLERAICEEPTPRPSVAVREQRHDMAADDRASLSRRLAGDVEAILLKALRKEPQERYLSAGELSADIERYLGGLPVVARDGSTAYRARKFVKRHRWRMGVLSGATIVLLAATVTYLIQITAARSEAERAAANALLERAKAERVADFLAGLFEAGDLEQTRGDTLNVFDLVDRGVDELDELRDEPAVQARLARVIGNVYHKLSKFEESQAILLRSAEILRNAPDEEAAELPETLEALFDLSISQGDYDAAEAFAYEAVGVTRHRYGEQHPRVASFMNRLGNALYYKGDSLAADTYRAALDMYRSADRPDSNGMASLLHNLGLIEKRNGKLEEAESYVLESIDILKSLGRDEARVADATRSLASIMRDQGRFEETERLYEQVVSMRRTIDGDTSVSLSAALSFLGSFQDQLGEYEAAVQNHSQSLEILTQLFGAHHQYSAIVMNNLANSYRMLGRYEEAKDLLEQSLAIRRKIFGEDHYRVATVLRQLGNVLSDSGDEEAALGYFQDALEIRRNHYGPMHKQTAASLNDVGSSLEKLGRIDEAAAALEEARQVWATIEDHDNARSRTNFLLGRVHLARGALNESEVWLRESLSERQVRFGEDHWLTASTQSLLGECLRLQGRNDEAERLLTQARNSLSESNNVPARGVLRKTLERIVALYQEAGQDASAVRYQEELALLDQPVH
ncbi:MAG: serine/threonine-protein kinase [Rhodothermia bacterium]|nr:serine/threonine-protein kinase [Rhodothermia bacterium]